DVIRGRTVTGVQTCALPIWRSEEMVASEDLANLPVTAAACSSTSRSAALVALPVISERAALAATLLANRAALAVTAALAGRLMEIGRASGRGGGGIGAAVAA